MATATTTNVSTLYADDTKWIEANPSYTEILDVVGAGANNNSNTCKTAILNLAQRSPLTVAFILNGDPDHIHVGHTITAFTNDPLRACPYDDHVVVFVGDDLASAAPVLLPTDSFARTAADVAAFNTAHMTGVNGHGTAGGAVFRFDHQASGTQNTDDIRARKVMVLPCDESADFLSRQGSGIYSVQNFYNFFLQPHAAAAAGIRAKWEPVEQWWRVACMNVNGGTESKLAVTGASSALPSANQSLHACTARAVDRVLTRVGVGGPQLSNAAFSTGVQRLETVLNNNAQQRLQFERDRAQKSFTDRYGEHLADHMYKMTGAADDDHLPDVHKVLAKAPKGQYYAILGSYCQKRAIDSPVPVFSGNLPTLTTKIVDQVFRSFQPCGNGNIFGEGLSPFSITCEGHAEYQKVLKRVRQAELTEAGNTTSMADAEALTTCDVRYPSTPQQAAEKLYGWSIIVDVFHGPETAIAKNIRSAVLQLGPRMHAVHASGGANAVGMDLCNRILYDAQQTYFEWAEQTALSETGATLPAAPTFSSLISAVRTNRHHILSPLPLSWYTLVDNPAPGAPSNRPSPSNSDSSSPRSQSGSVPVFNSNADRDMLTRFRESGHPTIKAMMEGKGASIPKHQNKPVCLVWALKGECSSNCKRKDLHIRYPATVNKAIHSMLDKCEVAALQG